MKKFKKLSSAVFSLVFALSLICGAGTGVMADGGSSTLLEADYDNTVPEFISFEKSGKKPETSIKGEDNKYLFVDDTKGWTYGGYIFSSAMEDDEYIVSFDFSIKTGLEYGMVYLTDDSITSNNVQYKEFKLLGLKNNKIQINGKDVSGDLVYSADHWYRYEMTIDKVQNKYEVTVTDKEAEGKSASYSGSDFPSKNINRMMFGTMAVMNIDNISVKKVPRVPKVSLVSFVDFQGNIQQNPTTETDRIRIRFTTDTDPDSLKGKISLKNGSGQDIKYTEEAKANIYDLVLDDILTEDTSYILTVNKGYLSSDGLAAENDYSFDFYVSDGSILLDIDYDKNKPSLELYDTNKFNEVYETENGNTYMTTDTTKDKDTVNVGYSLKNPIPKDGGDYKISFDFKDYVFGTGYVIALTQKDCLAGDGAKSTYNQFGLLSLKEDLFRVAGYDVPGLSNTSGKWYHYEISFNRKSRAANIVINEKDAPENVAQLSTTLPDENWGHGMKEDRIYDAIKFYNKGKISIDNILVKKIVSTPEIAENGVYFITNSGVQSNDKSAVTICTDKISVECKEEMNLRTFSGNTELKTKDGRTVGYTLSSEGTKVIFNLSDQLDPSEEYILNIKKSVISTGGISPEADFNMLFKTKARELKAGLVSASSADTVIDDISALTGNVSVKIDAANTSGSDKTYYLIAAFYDENGKMTAFKAAPALISDSYEGEVNVSLNIVPPENASRASIRLWENFYDPKPVSKALNY